MNPEKQRTPREIAEKIAKNFEIRGNQEKLWFNPDQFVKEVERAIQLERDDVWRLQTYYDDLAKTAGEKQRELEYEITRLQGENERLREEIQIQDDQRDKLVNLHFAEEAVAREALRFYALGKHLTMTIAIDQKNGEEIRSVIPTDKGEVAKKALAPSPAATSLLAQRDAGRVCAEALESIHDLLNNEIKHRLSGLSEDSKAAQNMRSIQLLILPRNMTREAIQSAKESGLLK